MTTGTIAALFGTMLAIAVVPGPSDLAVVARSIASGFSHGAAMVGGIVVADVLFVVFAIFGLAVIAEEMGGPFRWVRYACGFYLVALGAGSLRAGRARREREPPSAGASSLRASFATGLLLTLGDPKAILFYMGLLPAFLDPAKATPADAATVALVATVVVCGVKLTWAGLADRARALFARRDAMRGLDLLSGAVLVGAGLFLFTHA